MLWKTLKSGKSQNCIFMSFYLSTKTWVPENTNLNDNNNNFKKRNKNAQILQKANKIKNPISTA